jgi:hypothetical protein
MIDPLHAFDWSSLYAGYDSTCLRFDKTSIHLSAFGSRPPATDRELYYCLTKAFAPDRRATGDPIAMYEALLYWKLYSQPAARSNIGRWLRTNNASREIAERHLLKLFATLPQTLARQADTVISSIRQLDDFPIPGMRSSCALPVRTTLLHFMYPTVVPIFDKMVLKAVGVRERNANQKLAVLKEYLPFAWGLAEQHAPDLSQFPSESAIRVLDMALWVSRDNVS